MREIEIKYVEKTRTGHAYTLKVEGRELRFLFTYHSLERVKRWDLNLKDVMDALIYPEEVLAGHRRRFIAQKVLSDRIYRIVYEYEDDLPVRRNFFVAFQKYE